MTIPSNFLRPPSCPTWLSKSGYALLAWSTMRSTSLKRGLLLRVRLVEGRWAEPRGFFEEVDLLELGRDVKDGVSLRGHLREQSGVAVYPLEERGVPGSRGFVELRVLGFLQ
ncbi:F-box domain-containing protein [Psidium guajava]|nr:F-box domain-containing protein [Psidium guajava]